MSRRDDGPPVGVSIPVLPEDVRAGQRIAAERAALRHDFTPVGRDAPWVGHLGECVLDRYFRDPQTFRDPVRWHRATAAGVPDFTLGRQTVEVKTARCISRPRLYYQACMTEAKAHSSRADFFAFARYDEPHALLWFLGGIERPRFFYWARFYDAGTVVDWNHTSRAPIRSIVMEHLTPPRAWFRTLEELNRMRRRA